MSTNWVSHTPDSKSQDSSSHSNSTKKRSTSPPSPYEKFFLPIEDHSLLVQAASYIKNKASVSQTSESIRTDDFLSATEDFETAASCESDLEDISIDRALYKNDILGLSSPILEHEEYHGMTSKSKKKKTVTVNDTSVAFTSPETETPHLEADMKTFASEESQHFDVVDHVYEGAKSIWATGKGVSVFNIAFLKPFMGVAEGFATKVLSVATGADSLDSVDKNIKPHLKDFDHGHIDPAIVKLWKLLEPIVGKGDEIVKSMMNMVQKPFIKN